MIMLALAGQEGNVRAESAKFYFDRGVEEGKKGRFDQAIADFTKAIEINPRLVEAYIHRGVAYNQKGQIDQAISDFNKVLEINPRNPEAYYNRGCAYGSKGKHDQAIADFTNALGINPRDTMAYNNWAAAYYFNKAWEDVHKIQSMGGRVHPQLLETLRKASGRHR